MAYVNINNVTKEYQIGDTTITANDNINFEFEQGELVVIVGPSGAGKSTILNILGGMDTCDSGSIIIDNNDIALYNENQLTNYRRHDIGFVFQFYNLIPNLNVLENVELATQIAIKPLDAKVVLCDVGLENRLNNFPSQLSGGEQQRVAIARALAKNPKLLLCDEPTGALDYRTGKSILKLLANSAQKANMSIVIITHNQAIAPMANRVIEINDSKVRKITINNNPQSIDDIEW